MTTYTPDWFRDHRAELRHEDDAAQHAFRACHGLTDVERERAMAWTAAYRPELNRYGVRLETPPCDEPLTTTRRRLPVTSSRPSMPTSASTATTSCGPHPTRKPPSPAWMSHRTPRFSTRTLRFGAYAPLPPTSALGSSCGPRAASRTRSGARWLASGMTPLLLFAGLAYAVVGVAT